MATEIVIGQEYKITMPRMSWYEDYWGVPYETWIEITWKALETDPVNNTTTLSFTGKFYSTQTYNPNLGRGIRWAQVTVCNGSSTSDVIGTVYSFQNSTSSITYNGNIIFDSLNTSYKLENKTITISHGTGTTKDINICVRFGIGTTSWNNTSTNNQYTLPAIPRSHMVYVRDGNEWKKGKLHVYNGSQWVAPAIGASSNRGIYVWDGSEWKLGTARG